MFEWKVLIGIGRHTRAVYVFADDLWQAMNQAEQSADTGQGMPAVAVAAQRTGATAGADAA